MNASFTLPMKYTQRWAWENTWLAWALFALVLLSIVVTLSTAVLWFGSALLYGLSAIQLGAWEPILGWPVFVSLIVIVASLLGMLTGEWKHGGAAPLRIQWTGVALLIAAVFVLAETSRGLT